MAKTKQELIYQTLRNLGALPKGQDANDEDYNLVDDLIPAVQGELRETDTYFWPDTATVPDEAFLSLADVLAARCASSFGQQADDRLMQKGLDGSSRLEVMQSERPHYTTLKIQAY